MSYDRNIYFGWFWEGVRSTRRIPVGTESVRQCTGNRKHQINKADKFCAKCGSPILAVETPQTVRVPRAAHVLWEGEISPDDDGILTEEMLLPFKGFKPLMMEFISSDDDYEIIFAPGFKKMKDVGRSDGATINLDPATFAKPSDETTEALRKLFEYSSITLRFGAVMEVI